MYPVEAYIDLGSGQSFLHKAESLRTISSKISFRRRYTSRATTTTKNERPSYEGSNLEARTKCTAHIHFLDDENGR
jgi:hypothetical protein